MTEPDSLIVALAKATVEAGASDLHLTVGRPPTVRIDGVLVPFEGIEPLTHHDTQRLVMSVVPKLKQQVLADEFQVDFSFGLPGIGRFRANAFHQRNALALALRVIPSRIRPLAEMGAPPACTSLLSKPYGLVLVVGPTGSGKSTTLAAMIDRINEMKPVHILTIEDPIEYLHQHRTAIVNQREVGNDVVSFTDGLRSALREDPDVVLLGEMRDLDSIQIALTLAETGHLVMASLHTNDAAQALDRIVDVFPSDKRDQINTMLAGALQGVVSQRLLPAVNGGRVAAYEVLVGTDAVKNMIREGKSRQLRNIVLTGAGEGMQTIEMDLARLVASGLVSMETAKSISAFPNEIQANVATLRSQAQVAATVGAGQLASSGSGQIMGGGAPAPVAGAPVSGAPESSMNGSVPPSEWNGGGGGV